MEPKAFLTRLNRRVVLLVATAAAALLAMPALAFAHLERPSYWPDPNPDCSSEPVRRRQRAGGPLARVGG